MIIIIIIIIKLLTSYYDCDKVYSSQGNRIYRQLKDIYKKLY